MAVGGFAEDFVVSVAVELHGAEQSAVVLHAGASGRIASVGHRERAESQDFNWLQREFRPDLLAV